MDSHLLGSQVSLGLDVGESQWVGWRIDIVVIPNFVVKAALNVRRDTDKDAGGGFVDWCCGDDADYSVGVCCSNR
jgi:hypothetical protein